MSQTYNEYNVVLEKTTYEDKITPCIILKTHNYRGEKTVDFVAKNYQSIQNKQAINKKMFTPFHINIINSNTGKLVSSSKRINLPEGFLGHFIKEYNKGNLLETIELLIDMTTFELVKVNNTFQAKYPKKVYFRQDVIDLFNKMISETIPSNSVISLNAKTWVNQNI